MLAASIIGNSGFTSIGQHKSLGNIGLSWSGNTVGNVKILQRYDQYRNVAKGKKTRHKKTKVVRSE